MALNFPNNPSIDDTYTEGGITWTFDGSAWNVLSGTVSPANSFSTIAIAGQDTVVADTSADTLTLVAGANVTLTTNAASDQVTISSSAATNTFYRISVAGQDDIVADSSNDILTLVAGSGVVLTTNNTTDTLTISSSSAINSINDLTDVDTVSTLPTTGQVLKWNGSNWVPASDVTSGGGGTDADTLDGLDSAYFLNYNNLSNKPTIPSTVFNTIVVSGESNIIADSQTDSLTFVAGTGISITTDPLTDSLTITNTVTNTNTTYGISSETATGGVNLRLTGSDATTDNVKLAAGSNMTITRTDADTITFASTATGGTASNSFETISVSGQSNVVAESSTDTLTLVAGSGITITTDAGADSITITNSAAGSNAFGTVAVTGQTSVEADSVNDTLTLAAGAGISITTDAGSDTVTITSTVSAGATAFTGLSDVGTASLTVDKIYLPAITMLTVTNNGATAYRFDQYGAVDDPTIYAINATTIAFNLNVIGHPFLIQDNTGTNYNTGLVHVATNGTVTTGASAQGQTQGTLYWKISDSISGNYRYQCSIHAAMVGTITVKNFALI